MINSLEKEPDVLQYFRQMHRLDLVAACQIRDRARQFQHPVMPSRRLDPLPDRGRTLPQPVAVQLLGVHARDFDVDVDPAKYVRDFAVEDGI